MATFSATTSAMFLQRSFRSIGTRLSDHRIAPDPSEPSTPPSSRALSQEPHGQAAMPAVLYFAPPLPRPGYPTRRRSRPPPTPPRRRGLAVLPAAPGPAGCAVVLPVPLPLRGGRLQILPGQKPQAALDRTLIAALRRAHAMLGRGSDGHPTVATAPASPYERRLMRLAFLAPDIQRAILAGHQPSHCNLEYLMRSELPLAWPDQRATLVFAT